MRGRKREGRRGAVFIEDGSNFYLIQNTFHPTHTRTHAEELSTSTCKKGLSDKKRKKRENEEKKEKKREQ